MYLAFYDSTDRQLMSALMERIADLMLAVYQRLARETRENLGPGYHYRHTAGQKGKLLICQDSVTNISPGHYSEVIQPVDSRVAERLGIIGFHSCGCIQHHVRNWASIPAMSCVDVGQPEQNDVDALYAVAAPRRVALTRITLSASELLARAALDRFPTGVSLLYKAKTVEDGRRIWEQYTSQA
jgi:hypothetical protein